MQKARKSMKLPTVAYNYLSKNELSGKKEMLKGRSNYFPLQRILTSRGRKCLSISMLGRLSQQKQKQRTR
jgi:hypothetical protein